MTGSSSTDSLRAELEARELALAWLRREYDRSWADIDVIEVHWQILETERQIKIMTQTLKRVQGDKTDLKK